MLFITVFAMAGFGVFARFAEAKTAAEIATEVGVAQKAVSTAQKAYDTAKATYDGTVSVIEATSVYAGLKCSTVTNTQNNMMRYQCDVAADKLQPYTDALDTANTYLATVEAQKSDEVTKAEASETAANAVPGAVMTSLNTTVDTLGAQGVWTGTEWGTQSSSQATYDACASVPDVSTTATDTATGAEVTTTTKCDGTKIVKSTTKNADGTKTVVTTEKDANGTIIGTPKTETKASTSTTGEEDALLEQQKEACSIWGGGDAIMACLAVGIYYYAYKPFAVLLQVAGYIFDSSIVLSIDKNFVNQDFIKTVWTVIRDFSNMLFIFVLLFAGIQTMFGLGNYKETIRLVIIIALLINFSLFFTKVVIDAGNILAVGVFQAMGVTKTSTVVATKPGGVPERNLSEAIVANFRPGQFASTASKTSTNNAALVFVLAGVVNAFAAYILFRAALLFVGRLLIFWFLMIISPFAFISMALPKGNIFGWWWGTLASQAFMAPTFLFLLYLIMQIISSKVLNGFNMSTPDSATFFFASVIGPILVAVMIILALHQILKITEHMAGELGQMAQKYAGMIAGTAGTVALGVATGGASVAMRGTIGMAASAIGKSETLAGLATSERAGALGKATRWAGRTGQNISDRTAGASFDLRQIGSGGGVIGGFAGKYLDKGLGQFGVDVKKGAGAMGVKSGKGGYTAGAARRKQAKEDKDDKGAERVEVSEKEKPGVIAERTKEEREDVEVAAKKEKEEEDFVYIAERNKKDAEKNALNSETGQALNGATINVTVQEAAADKAKDDLEKIKQSTTATPDMIRDAENEARNAANALQGAEKALATAKEAHEKSPEMAEVKKATESLERAEKQFAQAKIMLEQATKILTEAEKNAVDKENERRREQYALDTDNGTVGNRVRRAAQAVVGGAVGSAAGPIGAIAGGAAGYRIGRNVNEARVARIRAGRSQKQKDEAKERATGERKKADEKAKKLKDLAKERADAIKDGASEGDAVIKHIDKRIKEAEKDD